MTLSIKAACCLGQANDLTWVFRFAIEATVRIGLIVSYMLVFEWRLALVAIAIIPVVGAINKWYGNWLHANQEKVQASLASANSVAHGALTTTTFPPAVSLWNFRAILSHSLPEMIS